MAASFGAGESYLAWDQSCDRGAPCVKPMKSFQNLSQLSFVTKPRLRARGVGMLRA